MLQFSGESVHVPSILASPSFGNYYERMLHYKNYHTWCSQILLPKLIMQYFHMVGDFNVTVYRHDFWLHFLRFIRDQFNYDVNQEFKKGWLVLHVQNVQESCLPRVLLKEHNLSALLPAQSSFLPHRYVSRSGK